MHSSLHAIIADAEHALLADTAQRLLAADSTVWCVDEHLQCINWLIVCGKHTQAQHLAQNLALPELSAVQQGKIYAALVRCGSENVSSTLPPLPLPRWLTMRHKLGELQEDHLYPQEIRDIQFSFEGQQEPCVHFTLQCLACQSIITTDKKSDFLPYRNQDANHWMCPHCLAVSVYDPAKVRRRVFDLYDNFFQGLSRDANGFLTESDASLALVIAASLRPFGLIRFLNLYSEKIGHYILNTSIYYSKRLMGGAEPSLDYLGLNIHTRAINATVTEMWRRLLPLSPAAGQIASMCCTTEHTQTLRQAQDDMNALERYPVVFPFTNKENAEALNYLEDMGIPRGSNFVCWHCRTDDYVKNEMPNAKKDVYLSYRNTPLEIFRKSIDYLLSKGYYVLRMGTEVMPPLSWQSEGLIDYATKYRTEFMDVWLFSHADLTVGTNSGIDCLPAVAGRNTLFASFAPMGYVLSFSSKTTVLFDHYYSRKANRRLTLQEIFASGFATNQLESEFAKNGFRIEKNTSDEILEAVKEKIFIMQGGTRAEEDILLEQSFKKLFYNYKSKLVNWYSPSPWYGLSLHGPQYCAQTSSVFLRQYRDELLRYAK